MENPELANAVWWYWFWELIRTISFFGVILALVIEFGAARLAAPYKEIIDHDREARIAAANERAAKAELELAKFKAPRTLTDEQVGRIVAAVSPFSGQEYGITTFWEMKEPLNFANRLFVTLNLAGWKYVEPPSATFMLGGVEGVQVWVHPKAEKKVIDAAATLISALAAEGIAGVSKEQNQQNPVTGKIDLNVGTKP